MAHTDGYVSAWMNCQLAKMGNGAGQLANKLLGLLAAKEGGGVGSLLRWELDNNSTKRERESNPFDSKMIADCGTRSV